jgi:hypothetical protein
MLSSKLIPEENEFSLKKFLIPGIFIFLKLFPFFTFVIFPITLDTAVDYSPYEYPSFSSIISAIYLTNSSYSGFFPPYTIFESATINFFYNNSLYFSALFTLFTFITPFLSPS